MTESTQSAHQIHFVAIHVHPVPSTSKQQSLLTRGCNIAEVTKLMRRSECNSCSRCEPSDAEPLTHITCMFGQSVKRTTGGMGLSGALPQLGFCSTVSSSLAPYQGSSGAEPGAKGAFSPLFRVGGQPMYDAPTFLTWDIFNWR